MARRWMSAGAVLAGLSLVWLPASALLISQIEFDLALPRGAVDTLTFSVLNNETDPLEIQISLADWDRDITGENRFYPPGTLPRSAAPWLSVSPLRFDLEPNKQQEVRFSIKVPSDIAGTYWAAIMVEAAPKQTQPQPPGTTVIVRRRFAVKVLETPPGTGTKDGRITLIDVRGLNPPNYLVEFENRGTIHAPRVTGRIELRDEKGTLLEKLDLESFPILPGAKRLLKVTSARKKGDLLPPGKYLVVAVLDYGGETLAGGQFVLRIKPLQLVPIGTASAPPQDLDKDGLYEDINADGKLTLDDPALLGLNLDRPAVQENARAFDFDNDGDADFDDVIALKKMAQGQTSSGLFAFAGHWPAKMYGPGEAWQASLDVHRAAVGGTAYSPGEAWLAALDGELPSHLDDLELLAHHLLELAPGAEGGHGLGGDHDALLGLRVDAHGALARAGLKGPKARNAHRLPVADRLGDGAEHRVYGLFGRLLA
jgi:P pilus assembly chaperone PapD